MTIKMEVNYSELKTMSSKENIKFAFDLLFQETEKFIKRTGGNNEKDKKDN